MNGQWMVAMPCPYQASNQTCPHQAGSHGWAPQTPQSRQGLRAPKARPQLRLHLYYVLLFRLGRAPQLRPRSEFGGRCGTPIQ